MLNCMQAGKRFLEFLASPDPQYSETPIDRTCLTAIIYVALPNFLFFFGWLNIPFAITFSGLTFFAIKSLFSDLGVAHKHALGMRPTLIFIVIAAIWCIFGGAGHFTYANHDWPIRDAVYADLIYSQWPPAYAIDDSSALLLRSAFGYFLPSALITSLVGIQVADWTLYLWTVIGITIFLKLLPIDAQNYRKLFTFIAIVIAFSGIDIIGVLIMTGEWPMFPLRLEWWTRFSYSSLSGQLFWAPNHTLPLWIGAALFFRHWGHPCFFRIAAVFVPLTLIWTPFAPLAFIPFFCLYLTRFAVSRPLLPNCLQIIWGIALSLLLCLFLTITIEGIETTSGVAHAGGSQTFWEAYLVFTMVEFGALSLLLITRIKASKSIFLFSVIVLLTLPFVFFGPSNDLLLRVSVPPLIFLMILTALVVEDGFQASSWEQVPWAIIAVLLIGACTPFNEIWRAATWKAWQPNYHKTLIDTQSGGFPPHYIGHLDKKSFWQYILKNPNLVPTSQARKTNQGS